MIANVDECVEESFCCCVLVVVHFEKLHEVSTIHPSTQTTKWSNMNIIDSSFQEFCVDACKF